MVRTPPLIVSNTALANLVLQQAYDAARLLEACCQSPDQVRTARALAFAVQGSIQALLTVGVADHEAEVVLAIVAHLERAGDALLGQTSTAARLTARAVGTTVAFIRQMESMDWEMEDDE